MKDSLEMQEPEKIPSSSFHAVEINEFGQPRSLLFDDRFFDDGNGLGESRTLFLEKNSLPQRFRELQDESVYRIGECGFGSGLNFLATVDLWLKSNAKGHLEFWSLERYPLDKNIVARILHQWPEITGLAEIFLEAYQAKGEGKLSVTFKEWRTSLNLIFADIHTALPQFPTPIDSWFFDGFSPRKNPDMWSLEALRCAYEKSSPQATGATFSVAGWIRRNFMAAGFTVEKVSGFGRKQEMLRVARGPSSDPSFAPSSSSDTHK